MNFMQASDYIVGDSVFDARYDWGKVIAVDTGRQYGVTVRYIRSDGEYDIRYRHDGTDGASERLSLLSYTKYTLQGFTKKRPLPTIAMNTLVYVLANNEWLMRFFSHFDCNGNLYYFQEQVPGSIEGDGAIKAYRWQLTNPHKQYEHKQ